MAAKKGARKTAAQKEAEKKSAAADKEAAKEKPAVYRLDRGESLPGPEPVDE